MPDIHSGKGRMKKMLKWKEKYLEGRCGEDAAYKFNLGVLTISGKGRLYDYESNYVDADRKFDVYEIIADAQEEVNTKQRRDQCRDADGCDPGQKSADPDVLHHGAVPWADYRNDIRRVMIEKGITTIGNNMFADCVNLESVAIPEGVTVIGYNAFRNCRNLVRVSFPGSLFRIRFQAFEGCHSLTRALIFPKVGLGEDVFKDCPNLKLYVREGSPAMKYAVRNNINYVNMGIDTRQGKSSAGCDAAKQRKSSADSGAVSDQGFEEEFLKVVKQYQQELSDARQFVGILKDCFPEAENQKHVFLMGELSRLGIVQAINDAEELNAVLLQRYTKRLVSDFAADESWAVWAVSLWCKSYGVNVLHKPCSI